MKETRTDITTGDVPPASPAAGTPDWPAQAEEIHCPLCEYNLRGLTEPRCPECGYSFEWKPLLDAKVRPHRYLFEHHPESNFKSFWKTAWGGLRPWTFWSELHPGMRSRPGRLVLYWLCCVLLGSGMLLGWAVPRAVRFARVARQERLIETTLYSPVSVSAPQALQQQLDRLYPLPPRLEFFDWLWRTDQEVRVVAKLFGILVAWPWLTFLVLMIFRISMRRARIRTVHVLRCIVYSYDAILWAGLAMAMLLPALGAYLGLNAAAGFLQPYDPTQGYYGDSSMAATPDFMAPCTLILASILLLGMLRLFTAYRSYLKFDWPIATILVSQLILGLIVWILALNVTQADVLWYWRFGY